MKNANLLELNVIELDFKEIIETNGGCGWYGWCADRWGYELDKAGEAFNAMFNEGWEDYDIH